MSDDDYEPEYEPERFTVAMEYHLEVLTVIPPPIEFMSVLHSNQQEISGRQVWCGSLLLAHVMEKLQKEDATYFRNKRILELGSGTGLVGMLVSKLGPPSCVALTDGDEQAMSLLQNNLQNPFNAIDSNIAKSTFLYWGNAMQPFHDWCQNSWPNVFQDSQVRFDILVAGDVMYKKELPGLFFQTVDSLLNKNGVLWLCHVPRSTVTHQYMMKAANDAGFTIQTHETSSLEVTNCPKDDLVRAVVYRIKR